MPTPVLLALCLTSASFSVLATVVLKLWSGTSYLVIVLPVCFALGTAAWFESMALPGARLGIVFVLILAFEAMLGIGVAVLFGESYGLREVVGLATILVGIAILYLGQDHAGT